MDRILEYRVEDSDLEKTVNGILGKVLKYYMGLTPHEISYLAGIKLLNDMGKGNTEKFEEEFLKRFRSIKCGELRKSKVPCNDLVGGAADIVDTLLQ